MRLLVLLVAVLVALPAAAEEPWVLRSGPDPVGAIPLEPVQPVPAWRGQYADGNELIVVYVTRSPYFYGPAVPEVRALSGTPWTAVVFFPPAWKAPQRSLWFDLWAGAFQNLATLPSPGWPVLFPAVLRKG